MQDSDQFGNAYLKIWFISFKLMTTETSLWRHNHQYATLFDATKGTIVMKYFFISSELNTSARCKKKKKHMSYFGSVYLYLIATDMYTISLASKLLEFDEFSTFDESENWFP